MAGSTTLDYGDEEEQLSPLTSPEPDEDEEDAKLPATFGTLLDTFKYKASTSTAPTSTTSSPSKSLSPTRATRRSALLATTLSSRSSPRKRFLGSSTPKMESADSPSTTPRKKFRRTKTAGHLDAESYRHVPDLPDNLAPGLILVFIGANPGIKSGLAGHAFSHPTNHFWRRLYLSGITPTVLQPINDVELPEKYQVGRTDLILRTSRLESDIPEQERLEAWKVLEEKIRTLKPEAVCVLSKGTWKMMYQGIYGRQLREQDGWEWGWQEGQRIGAVDVKDTEDGKRWDGSKVWVMPSTSGRVTVPTKSVQEGMWMELGKWVNAQRKARGDVVGGRKEEKSLDEVKMESMDRADLDDVVLKEDVMEREDGMEADGVKMDGGEVGNEELVEGGIKLEDAEP